MAKSRSKISRQPVKKSKRTASRRARPAGRAKSGAAPFVAAKAKKGQWVYAFGGGKAQGRGSMRNLLGGKGAGLAEMASLGLPVPPGFTITTEVCTYFYANGESLPEASQAAGRDCSRRSRPHHRQEIRRRRESAAGLGALGCARVDARHDGHRA